MPKLAPGIFHGPVLVVTVLVGLLAATIVPAVLVWRRPTLPVALLTGGLGLLGVFLPATNFRPPYLVLVFALASGGWLALDPAMAAGTEDEPATGPGAAGPVPAVRAP